MVTTPNKTVRICPVESEPCDSPFVGRPKSRWRAQAPLFVISCCDSHWRWPFLLFSKFSILVREDVNKKLRDQHKTYWPKQLSEGMVAEVHYVLTTS
jgi:hypothetical protein